MVSTSWFPFSLLSWDVDIWTAPVDFGGVWKGAVLEEVSRRQISCARILQFGEVPL